MTPANRKNSCFLLSPYSLLLLNMRLKHDPRQPKKFVFIALFIQPFCAEYGLEI